MAGQLRSALAEHLEKIPYFVTIAQAGSLQAAALQLRLSQPSLSKSMQILEAALDVALLTRGRRGVTLTEAGQQLLAFAEPLLAQAAAVEERLKSGSTELNGEIRIGTHEVLVKSFWPQVVRAVAKAIPQVRLSLYTNPSISDLRRRLQSSDLDLILVAELAASADLVRQEIRKDVYQFFVTPQFCKAHGLKKQDSLKPHDLEDLPIIYADKVIAGPGVTLDAALQAVGMTKPSLYQVRSLESVLALIKSDLGLGLLPTRMVEAEVASGELWSLNVAAAKFKKLGEHGLYCACLTPRIHDKRLKFLAEQVAEILE